MKITLTHRRRPASAAEVDAALARLDAAPGMYLGVDAGIAGLHPLQAVLVDQPALVLTVHADGVRAAAHTALGTALLAHPALAGWVASAQPGRGAPLASLRALLQAFEPSPDVLLQGALRFDAHVLGGSTQAVPAGALGVLFLAQSLWQRDAAGQWTHVALSLDGAAVAQDEAHAHPVAPPGATVPDPQDDYLPGGHAQMVARALVHLREQPLVSLTLSQSFRRRCTAQPSAAFARLRRVNPAPAMFFLNDGTGDRLFGASPDLQLVVQGRTVQALPVCGTVARGTGPVGEAESFRVLVNEDTDAASLAVCSDALRNDLAPLCEPGTLHLRERRRQMSLATVVHTVDRLQGTLREGVDAWDAIAATTAPAMVTGTPRGPALAAIAQLEAAPRGWYGGLAVQVRADGSALAGTILRAAVLRAGVAEVRTGGDLLADSVPAREEQESRLKAISLWRALGLEDAPAAAVTAAAVTPTPPTLPAAVGLEDSLDPFGAALRDTLLGLGLRVEPGALPTVRAGHAAHGAQDRQVLAVGDSALRLLACHGATVVPITPEHGRLVHCTPAAPHAWPGAAPFTAARYATLALASGAALPDGWQAWAHDATGAPVLLVHAPRRLACLLVRPDSLLAGDGARAALAAALAFCAGAADAP
ncbi:MAG: chorismate-binding protein [Ramlibacter sp.]